MDKYNYYQKIICLGDESRYLFIRDLFPENMKIDVTNEELHDNDIFITYNENNYVEKYPDKKIIAISLNTIPIYKLIYIPIDTFYMSNQIKHIDKVLLFNSFPYGKLNLIEYLEEVLEKYEVGDILAILYREKRRFSATDLSSEEEAINIAKDNYAKRGIRTRGYNPKDYYEDIFEVNPNFIMMFKDSYKRRYAKAKNRFSERYEKEYDFNIKSYFNMFTILDPDEYRKFDNLFSFNMVKNSDDIWETFMFNFKKKYIDAEFGILNIVQELYMEFINDICVWNLNKDLSKLNETVLNEYKEYFGKEKILKTPANELDYIKLMNIEEENSLDVIFKNKLNSFANSKLKIILHKYIENSLNNIKLKMEEKNDEDN